MNMNYDKTSLIEMTLDGHTYTTARGTPMSIPKSMNFLKSLIENIEPIEDEAKDHVSFDVPLLIRLLELAREDIKSDVELHYVVERILSLKNKGVLTMDDYNTIASREKENSNSGVKDIQRLAGIK